jgi:hypothetical protein
MLAKKRLPLALYLLLTVVMTWPLAIGVAKDVPGDLGDSLLNLWILGWGAENVPRVLTGQMAPHDFWNANIFHPEPLALSFSEHLFGEVVQILPIYYLTGNLILCYNLLFLASFALSGLGMYLLVRDLLGENDRFSAAAFAAGLIYAFLPFRIAQVAHIQSVNAQWMPLALYGFRRFIRSAPDASDLRLRPLAGGAAALLMQNWSCGYYLVFFAPFSVLFVVHQMWAAGRAVDWRRWLAFAVAGLAVAIGTWPFLTLYLEAQRVHGFERSLSEVIRFSADVYSYFSAPEALRLWGPIVQAYPKPEGELFFGFTPMLLAIVGAAAFLCTTTAPTPRSPRWVNVAGAILAILIAVQAIALVVLVLTGGAVATVAGLPIRATNPLRLIAGIAVASALLCAISPAARARLMAFARSPLGLATALLLLALWLSLGPLPQSRGRPLPGLGLYGLLYDHVPGFAGLRVPARYAIIAGVFLSMMCGYGVAALMKRTVHRAAMAVAICAAFVVEAWFAPMYVNQTWGDSGVTPPAHVETAAHAPAVYQAIRTLPDTTIVTEFPFGDPAWELRYVYYSTAHWKRIVNGYSGGFPQSYKVRVALLQRVSEHPDAAWSALRDAGTTTVVVHEAAYLRGAAAPVEAWLAAHGATEQQRFGSDVLFAMPR